MRSFVFSSSISSSRLLADERMTTLHDARLEKLETQIAFLERTVDELNAVVVEQSKQLSKLQAQMRKVSDAMDMQELERIRATNSKPPHYQ